MLIISQPIVTMPPVYEIPMNLKRWCKLGEVLEAARNCASISGVNVEMTIPNVLRRYASLVRRNQWASGKPGRKIFRYSPDGFQLCGQDVPEKLPFGEFILHLNEDTFVTEEWTIDLLSMIRRGCFETREYDDLGIIGIWNSGRGNQIAYLDRPPAK